MGLTEIKHMRTALLLAKRGHGCTSPNPMVGAVLVKGGRVIGRGWHRKAGLPHAEIEAMTDAQRRGHAMKGATLYVTLEPCSTLGRTPPCTDAIIAAGIRKVVIGTVDPNPRHRGKGLILLRRAGIQVSQGVLAEQCARLNKAFNYWITRGRPFVTVKSAMTLDGKIATATGQSKWITGARARKYGMNLRKGADAVLVGVNTILADDPRLTVRVPRRSARASDAPHLRRIVLDAYARTPLQSKVVSDAMARLTTIVVGKAAPKKRIQALAKCVRVLQAPTHNGLIELPWVLGKLGAEDVTSLLVEGGGEVNASFLLSGLAQHVAFFYAPKILGGAAAIKAVGGEGIKSLKDALALTDVEWRKLGGDWLLTASIAGAD